MSRSEDSGTCVSACVSNECVVRRSSARRYALSAVIRGGAADGETVDPERRLPDTDGNALTILAAGSDAVVQLEIVPDHRYACEHVRPVADEGRPLERCRDASVLDGVGLARGEDELAGSDIHLTAAEVHRVDAAFHGADDLLWRMRPGAHVGVG